MNAPAKAQTFGYGLWQNLSYASFSVNVFSILQILAEAMNESEAKTFIENETKRHFAHSLWKLLSVVGAANLLGLFVIWQNVTSDISSSVTKIVDLRIESELSKNDSFQEDLENRLSDLSKSERELSEKLAKLSEREGAISIGLGDIEEAAKEINRQGRGDVLRIIRELASHDNVSDLTQKILDIEDDLAEEPIWIAARTENGWRRYTSDWAEAAYVKDRNGIVHLKGMLSNGSATEAMFTLPVGYRPATHHLFTVTAWDTPSRVDVTPEGAVVGRRNMSPTGGEILTKWVSLSGISFRAER